MTIKVNDKDISAYFLDGRIKFDRPEGAIGHSEAVLDFYGNEAVTVSRGETVEITTANNTLYFIVEKITETKDSSKIGSAEERYKAHKKEERRHKML